MSYRDQSNRVQFVTKTRQDNDMANQVYLEIEIELLGPI